MATDVTDEKFQRVIEDIYSLKISTLPSIEHEIREDGLAFLKSGFVTNPSVTMLYDDNTVHDEIGLVAKLRTMNPYFAQMAHVLFVNSNVGLLKRLPSRFTSVRIESIVTQNRRKTLVEAINEQNCQYKKMFRWRLINGTECQIRKSLINMTCSTVVADMAREVGWDKTFVSLTKPVPQHQFSIIPMDIAQVEHPEGFFCGDFHVDERVFETKPKFATISAHHSSPIYAEECRALLTANKSVWKCKKHKKIRSKIKKEGATAVLSDVCTNPRNCIRSSPVPKISPKFLTASLESWAMQKLWFLSSAIRGGVVDGPQVVDNIDFVRDSLNERIDELTDLYHELRQAEYIKDPICNKEILLGNMLPFMGCHFERDISIMRCKCHGTTLTPTSLIIDSLDQMQTRFSLFLYRLLCDITKKRTLSLLDKGSELVSYFDKLLTIMGDDLFSVLSIWEPLMLGWVILFDDDIGFRELFDTQLEEITLIYQKHREALNLADLLPMDQNEETASTYLEMLGIMKHFGYPVLDIRELLDPLKQYGTGVDTPVKMDIVRKVMGVVKRDFSENFRKKQLLMYR